MAELLEELEGELYRCDGCGAVSRGLVVGGEWKQWPTDWFAHESGSLLLCGACTENFYGRTIRHGCDVCPSEGIGRASGRWWAPPDGWLVLPPAPLIEGSEAASRDALVCSLVCASTWKPKG